MPQTNKQMSEEQKLERCGYCGRWFVGDSYLLSEQLKKFTQEELDNAPLGYGPDAQREHYEQNPDDYEDQYNSDCYLR